MTVAYAARVEPYFADETGQVAIYHGDCRDVLSQIAPGPVDLALFSPPYFAQRQYGDDPREIGTEDDPREYLVHLIQVTRQLASMLDPDGSIVVNIGDKYQADGPVKNSSTRAGYPRARRQPRWPGLSMKSLMMLPARYAVACTDELGLALRGEIIWDKGSGGADGKARDRVRRAHEAIYHFTRALKHGEATGVWDLPGPSVWRFGTSREKLVHQADYPVELAARCIACWSRPEGLVLDPFMGSGTTLVAARALGRRVIGIDIEERYCAEAVERLAQQSMNLSA